MQVVLLGQEGCTPCLRVRRLLAELGPELPGLEVREVEFRSAEGMDLALANSVFFPPAVFVDGRLVAKGKIFPETLRTALVDASRPGPS